MTKKKKVLVKSKSSAEAAPATPTTSKFRKTQVSQADGYTPVFNRQNYILTFGAIGLVILGFLLMMGGNMPSADVWDDSIIYSFRRITLAPICILAGFGLGVYAIFK